MSKLLCACAIAGSLAAQTLVVDRRRPPNQTPVARQVERDGKGFVGDSFKVGNTGEIWILDTIRVWALPSPSRECPKQPGDQLEKITLLGALDNPPVPGQPICACHALITIGSGSFAPGSATPASPAVKFAEDGGLWRIDFENLRWSLPGGLDVLFAVRASGRPDTACAAGRTWALSSSAAAGEYRLFTFDKDALEDGFLESTNWINVQVWAHRSGQ